MAKFQKYVLSRNFVDNGKIIFRREFYLRLYCLLFTSVLVFFNMSIVMGQNQPNKSKEIHDTDNEEIVYAPHRENLMLSVSDTIINSRSYYFSNENSKDIFRLIVSPGFVKSSKSEFQIMSHDGTIIYSQIFDSFVMMMRIFEPDEVPSGVDYEAYRNEYYKSITTDQYDSYFKQSIQHFFDNISFIDSAKFHEIAKRGNAIDKKALDAVLAGEEGKIIHKNCFTCDTGGSSILYFSKERGKVIEILGLD